MCLPLSLHIPSKLTVDVNFFSVEEFPIIIHHLVKFFFLRFPCPVRFIIFWNVKWFISPALRMCCCFTDRAKYITSLVYCSLKLLSMKVRRFTMLRKSFYRWPVIGRRRKRWLKLPLLHKWGSFPLSLNFNYFSEQFFLGKTRLKINLHYI